jgi:uncharacterized protein (DUF1330 family)
MPAYVLAEVEITNPEGYEAYRPLAGATVAEFGGKFVVRGGSIEPLEGDWPTRRRVMIEFADVAAAKRWYFSPQYQAALKVRQANSRGRVAILEGLPAA